MGDGKALGGVEGEKEEGSDLPIWSIKVAMNYLFRANPPC